jgi:hypothetical protein
VEENIDRKLQHKFQGNRPRGKGKISVSRGSEKENESTNTQSNRGGNGTRRGRGFEIEKGKYIITYYICGVEGHKAYECPKK